MGMYALAPLTSLNQIQCKSISVINKIPEAVAICHSYASGTRSITLIMQQTVQL